MCALNSVHDVCSHLQVGHAQFTPSSGLESSLLYHVANQIKFIMDASELVCERERIFTVKSKIRGYHNASLNEEYLIPFV